MADKQRATSGPRPAPAMQTTLMTNSEHANRYIYKTLTCGLEVSIQPEPGRLPEKRSITY